ncbi:hypothetical protein Tco_1108284 [Tanacetum coccineum]
MATNEETNAAGTDTRPPMLVENDYESWKIRIHRKKLDSEFQGLGKKRKQIEMADTQAEIILSQGLFNKGNLDIGIVDRKGGEEDLFDEYELFVNTSFVNNLPGLYVVSMWTNVNKNNGYLTTPLFHDYTHLKAYEPHAKKTLKKQEQSTSIVDPLAYVAHTKSAPALSSLQRYIVTEPIHEEGSRSWMMAPMLLSLSWPTLSSTSANQLCRVNEAQNVPTEVSADTSDKVSMIAILTDLQTQLDGHAKGKEKSIAFLQSEKEKIFSEKKDLADSYLDEIVCLKNANKVARDMLQRFNMPTQTIPMLSKKPKAATADLHKDLLGTRNPGLGYMAKRAQPALYDADTLFHPTHHPLVLWDSVEAYWLSANEIASQTSKPATPPFVHKSRPPSQVLASLRNVNAIFPQFEGSLKVENVSLKRRYDELSKANTHSRTAYTEKLSAFTAEHTKLKAQNLNLATESHKPMPKSHTRNHHILTSKSVNARKAAYHNRKLHVVDHNQFVIRSFELGDQLERIMEPIVEPLELTPSVRSSSKVTMISRSKGRTVADSIAARLTRPTAYMFKKIA